MRADTKPLTCPRCGNSSVLRAGWRHSTKANNPPSPRQQYVCRDCNRWWTAEGARRGRPPQPKTQKITLCLSPHVKAALENSESPHDLDSIVNLLLKGYLGV